MVVWRGGVVGAEQQRRQVDRRLQASVRARVRTESRSSGAVRASGNWAGVCRQSRFATACFLVVGRGDDVTTKYLLVPGSFQVSMKHVDQGVASINISHRDMAVCVFFDQPSSARQLADFCALVRCLPANLMQLPATCSDLSQPTPPHSRKRRADIAAVPTSPLMSPAAAERTVASPVKRMRRRPGSATSVQRRLDYSATEGAAVATDPTPGVTVPRSVLRPSRGSQILRNTHRHGHFGYRPVVASHGFSARSSPTMPSSAWPSSSSSSSMSSLRPATKTFSKLQMQPSTPVRGPALDSSPNTSPSTVPPGQWYSPAHVPSHCDTPDTVPDATEFSLLGHHADFCPAAVVDTPGGMRNIGNTCYMNAVLQAVLSLPCLLGELHADGVLGSGMTRTDGEAAATAVASAHSDLSDPLMTSPSVRALRQVVQARRRGDTISESALAQLKIPGFEQQDAHEFLMMLLGRLPDKTIDRVFGSRIRAVITCTACGTVASSVEEAYRDLSLDVPDDTNGTSLDRLLRGFFAATPLEGLDCEACGCATQMRVTRSLSQQPHILILHLKRFRAQSTRRRGYDKLLTAVQYPLSLDVPGDCDGSTRAGSGAKCSAPPPPLRWTGSLSDLLTPRAADASSPAAAAQSLHLVDELDLDQGAAADASAAGGMHTLGDDASGRRLPGYTLHAVVCHTGTYAHTGHYVADVRTELAGDGWTTFDDLRTRTLPRSNVVSHGRQQAAYLLFYLRDPVAKSRSSRQQC